MSKRQSKQDEEEYYRRTTVTTGKGRGKGNHIGSISNISGGTINIAGGDIIETTTVIRKKSIWQKIIKRGR